MCLDVQWDVSFAVEAAILIGYAEKRMCIEVRDEDARLGTISHSAVVHGKIKGDCMHSSRLGCHHGTCKTPLRVKYWYGDGARIMAGIHA